MENEIAGAMEKPADCQMITPVGNAWLMSRSKSHNGRVYYFNTATGEAVWNLSNEEIEKAKAQTSKLKWASQSGILPEPKGPPEDYNPPASISNFSQQPKVSQYATPNVYNKQIINNQFARTPYTPFIAPCQNCNPLNPMQNMGAGGSQRPFTPVWVQPPPVFLTSPPNTSMHNINPTTENVHVCHHQEFHGGFTAKNTSISLSRRFGLANQQCKNFKNSPRGYTFKRRFNNFNGRRPPFFPKKMEIHKNICDLRSKLSAKKTSKQENSTETTISKNESNEQECVSSDNITKGLQTTSTFEVRTTQRNLHTENDDDEWLKIHGKIDGAKLKLDVTVLKNFATDNLECECWYIVADKNVLINHFNFLNVLTTSDEQCKLMVVRGVMSDLQAAARADASKDAARKVLRGLSQLFAAKLAVIAEYSFTPVEIKDCSGMINFCAKLLEQNEHVILLSNEEVLDKYTTKVPKFSIPEIKDLLTGVKYKICSPIIERNIKITIPNYGANNELDDMEISSNAMETTLCDKEMMPFAEETLVCDEDTETNQEDTVLQNTCDVMQITEKTNFDSNTPVPEKIAPNKKETNVQTDSVFYSVKMVDAEVQTEPGLEFMYRTIQKDSIGTNTEEINFNIRYVDRETSLNKTINFGNIAVSNEVHETREIRLKRSFSNQTVGNTNENTHHKWHRKKRDDAVLSDSSASLDGASRMSNYAFESNTFSAPSRCQSTQMCYEYEGSETSSCMFQRPTSENIIIEETSASDIISNSVSNENINEISNPKETSAEEQSKNVMFEITSKSMELNLKMRSDEWLAQFIQIMEEVLGQVLERESKQIVNAMPPPWTLHEATECVKRTFSNDSDVVDAATKLSQVIYKMSDAKGKIMAQFKPNDFMELYSYGVYLVDTLQSIMEKFDDLQIAAESLAKLLSDIENPIGDVSHNNSFDDATDISVVISQSSVEGPANKGSPPVSNKSANVQSDMHKSTCTKKRDFINRSNTPTPRKTAKAPDAASSDSSRKYNLRSARKKKNNEDNMETSPTKFIRKVNIPEEFFTSLRLKRKEGETDDPRILKQTDTNDKEMEPTNKSPTIDKPADNGPNIIRNFTRCLEFEERLNKQSREPLDMDMLDYSMCYDDEYDNMEAAYSEQYNQNQIEVRREGYPENEVNHSEDNNDFRVIVNTLVNEFRETIVTVQTFCKKVIAELQSQNMETNRRNEIRDIAHNAKSRVSSACDSLQRIKECDFDHNGTRFPLRLEEAGVFLNENEVSMYRDVIDSCVGHGDSLSESLNLIIDAVNI